MRIGWLVLAVALFSCLPLAAQSDSVQQGQAPDQPVSPRITIINMAEVIKSYKKAQIMEADLDKAQQALENKLKPFNKPRCMPCNNSELIEMLKLESDCTAVAAEVEEAKKDLAKRKAEVYQQLYHEVQDGANRIASSNGYAVLLFFSEGSDPDEK
jgi:Skp family chaperone for outer membrane proteins